MSSQDTLHAPSLRSMPKHVPLQVKHNKSTYLHIPYNCSSIIRCRDKPVGGYNIDVVQWDLSIAGTSPKYVARKHHNTIYWENTKQWIRIQTVRASAFQYVNTPDTLQKLMQIHALFMVMYRYIIPSLNESMDFKQLSEVKLMATAQLFGV